MHHRDGVFGARRRVFLPGAFTVDGSLPCFFFSIDHGVYCVCLPSSSSSSSSSFLFAHTLASREGRRLLFFLSHCPRFQRKASHIYIYHRSSILLTLLLSRACIQLRCMPQFAKVFLTVFFSMTLWITKTGSYLLQPFFTLSSA
jgi:hypothetical protein